MPYFFKFLGLSRETEIMFDRLQVQNSCGSSKDRDIKVDGLQGTVLLSIKRLVFQ